MEDSAAKFRKNNEAVTSLAKHVNREYSEVDVLRKAYELILDNSDIFFSELEKSFRVEREKGGFNPMI